MWLTPTYHAFAMYAAHRGATAVRTEIESAPSRQMPAVQSKFPVPKVDEGTLSMLSASASVRDNAVVVSVSNRSFDTAQEVEIRFAGDAPSAGFLSTLSGDAANSANTFEDPDRVGICRGDAVVRGDKITVTLPPCSVQTLVLKSR